jgi:hypothetical protein
MTHLRYPKSARSPLVFLILPVTIVFAMYPGFVELQTGF